MSTRQYLLPRVDIPERDGVRLLYVTRAQFSAEWDSALHTHSCSEFFFVTGGQGAFQIQNERFSVSRDDLVVVNAAVAHTELGQAGEPMEYVVLGVEGLEAFAGPSGYTLIRGVCQQPQVRQCLDMILLESSGEMEDRSEMCQSLLRVLLRLVTRQRDFFLEPAVAEPRSNREMAMVRRYIDTSFKESITLDKLAALAHLNKYYLVHAFQREYGVSPIRYLVRRRIRESRFLLSETDLSLSHIAQTLGFSSLSYFSQCFRRVEGISPKEYRQRRRAGLTDDLS